MFVYKAIKEIIIACICVTMNRQSEAHNRDSKCLPSWYIFVNDAFKMSLSAKTLRCGYMTLLNQKSGLYQNATLCVDSVNKTGQSGCYTITYITCKSLPLLTSCTATKTHCKTISKPLFICNVPFWR